MKEPGICSMNVMSWGEGVRSLSKAAWGTCNEHVEGVCSSNEAADGVFIEHVELEDTHMLM